MVAAEIVVVGKVKYFGPSFPRNYPEMAYLIHQGGLITGCLENIVDTQNEVQTMDLGMVVQPYGRGINGWLSFRLL